MENNDVVYTHRIAGAVAVADDAVPYSVAQNLDLVAVYLAAGTAPAGADLIVNVRKNGTDVWAGADRPKIVAGQTKGNKVIAPGVAPGANVITPTVPTAVALATFSPGDTFNVDVEQVGSGTAGSNLGVTLAFIER